MPYTLYNDNNLMDEIYNFRDKYLKEYRLKNTNISILKKANLLLNTNISLDSLRHSNTFAIYKLMRGNLDTILPLKDKVSDWNS